MLTLPTKDTRCVSLCDKGNYETSSHPCAHISDENIYIFIPSPNCYPIRKRDNFYCSKYISLDFFCEITPESKWLSPA